MCGIAGVFSLEGPLPPDVRAAVPAMTTAMEHRGPDGDGYFSDDRVVLGHRRLIVIDPTGGRQPMANEDESCWIVFNGEIYNHRELRAALQKKGHRFRSACDTEAILHAYEEFGPACVQRLDGMFAFAIYDQRKREIFAARDRLGKKPFFYTTLNGVFHFASELPALRRSPFWRGDLDFSGLEGYLSLGYFLAPSTIYRDVYKLPPACTLRVRAGGSLQVESYWDVPEFDTDDRPQDVLVDELDERLRGAVQKRLESDVPLGAFLSGGLDSGLVVSYMAETLADRLVTVSAGFGEPAYSELQAAGWTARHFGSRHEFEVVGPRLQDVVGPITERLGEPLADSSAIPTWYLSRAAKSHATVVLSGDGGDESFLGYDFRYTPHAVETRVRPFIPRVLLPVVGWLGSRWPRTTRLPRAFRVGPMLENLGRDEAASYYTDLTFLRPADARRVLGLAPDRDPRSSSVYEAVTAPYRRSGSKDPVQRSAYADLKVYLPNNSLVKLDRMSMAHGLEVRCPLLDHDLVEFAFRVPARQKHSLGEAKRLLRSLAKQRLPDPIWNLPKKGFSAPIAEWITSSNATVFEDEVLRDRSAISAHLDVRELRRRLHAHTAGERDEGYVLWATWVLERWMQNQ